MILLIDNYDSFSYNLFQMVGSICPDMRVVRNDALTVEEAADLKPDGIILSPGPGRPEDAGICVEVVEKLSGVIPILGVCLGHQAICRAFGATVSYAKQLMHGKQSEAELDQECVLFRECAQRTLVGRYHSLAAVEETMPDCLRITARTRDGEIMAVQHRDFPVYGLQFHPESILTPEGGKMLRSWYASLSEGPVVNTLPERAKKPV